MSDAGAADEWDLVVPEDDAELVAELRRHGVKPGQRLRIRNASGKYRSAVTGRYVSAQYGKRAPKTTVREGSSPSHEAENGSTERRRPAFFGSVKGEPDQARRSEEILRAEFPGE